MKTFPFKRFSAFLMTLILLISSSSGEAKDPAKATVEALEVFQDMRFGLFIHFSLFSQGVSMRGQRIPRDEYRKTASTFNPSLFNPQEIVGLAKQAGMKYIVITAKHHEGFAMFGSEYDNYNIRDGTPYGEDLILELSNECKTQGMKLGFYYSHTRDWDEYHSTCKFGNDWDWDKDDPGRNPQIYFDNKVKPQLTELLTKYGEVFCMWFDTPYIITIEQAEDLYNLVKSLQPACLVNSRIGRGLGDYGVLGDNQVPPGVVSGPWETPVTMNDSWPYSATDNNWKSSQYMITQLVDLSSKNVNYLLNIGPKPDGSVPKESKQRLEDIGEWLTTNGEAIYNAGPSPWFQEMDGLRITTGKNVLYITLLNPGMGVITLYNLYNKITGAELLSDGRPVPFEYEELENPAIPALTIRIPEELRTQNLPVIKIYLDGPPEVQDMPTQMSTGNILLQAKMANVIKEGGDLTIFASDGTKDLGEWPCFATMNWNNTKDHLEWDFNVIEPGRFKVKVVNVSTTRKLARHMKNWNAIYQDPSDYNRVSLSVNEKVVSGRITGGEPIESIRSAYRPEYLSTIGTMEFRQPGIYKAVLKADFINPSDSGGLVIYEVRFEKVN